MKADEETEHKDIWNVFVPWQLLEHTSGYLFGKVDRCERMINVHGISCLKLTDERTYGYIGTWRNSIHEDLPLSRKDSLRHSKQCSNKPVHLSLWSDEGKICGTLLETLPSGHVDQHLWCAIFFSPESITSSYFLNAAESEDCSPSDPPDSSSPHQYACTERISFGKTIPSLVKCLKTTPVPTRGSDVQWFPSTKSPSLLQRMVITTTFGIMAFLHHCGSTFDFVTRWLPWPVKSILTAPASIQHLVTRHKTYWSLATPHRLQHKSSHHTLILYNSAFQQLVDLALGMVVCLLITQKGHHQSVAGFVLSWADDVGKELMSLVQWLMGAPAGLKLNAQLTQILGHFFLYHIYLWTGYLKILQNVMPSVLWYLSLTGVLGVSFQLCLVQDVLSMLTLHIYCFYVYAARIFHLQTYTLSSLWRLFRGKKWNVLRSRVDSASYNTDRLFVGTLLFTVLLFLLPTTLLYYAVFTLLRLVVLFAQGILSQLVHIVTTTPVFALLLRLIAPKHVAGSVVFRIQQRPQNEEDCLVLNMQTTQFPLSTLRRLSLPSEGDSPKTHTLWELLSNLATGRLIYPWVNKISSQSKTKTE